METVAELNKMIEIYGKFAKDSIMSDFIESLEEIKKGLHNLGNND